MQTDTLQSWMDKKGLRDEDVAKALRNISRVQVNRIRRGVAGASITTAMKLEALTGIGWQAFVRETNGTGTKKRKRKIRATSRSSGKQ